MWDAVLRVVFVYASVSPVLWKAEVPYLHFTLLIIFFRFGEVNPLCGNERKLCPNAIWGTWGRGSVGKWWWEGEGLTFSVAPCEDFSRLWSSVHRKEKEDPI